MQSAVICRGPQKYEFLNDAYPVPKPGDGELLVEVELAGICAGDAKCFHGAMLFWGDESTKRTAYCEPPCVPGHEFVCRVSEIGSGYEGPLKIGDRVVAEQIVPCQACRFCLRGDAAYHMCQPHRIFGFKKGLDGSWQQRMILPARALVYKIPDSLPARAAVYCEPLACAIHAVERATILPTDVVVVSGAGALGLGMIAHARQKNPAKLIALDLKQNRLDIAKKCGADLTLNPRECNVVEEIKSLTEGYGCDVYIEATGAPQSVEQGLLAISKLGRFVEFSVFQEKCTVDWTIIGDTKELDIRGAHLSPKPCYELAIDLLKRDVLPIEEIVTHILPLSEFKRGIDLVSTGGENSIKVVLKP